MTQNNILLSVEDLQTYYDIRKGVFSRVVGRIKAVDGVSLDVFQGETVGLVGESGCGKSTVGKSIIRLEKPTAGKIIFEGKDITGLSGRDFRNVRTSIQMVFQDPYSSLNPRRTIGGMLKEILLTNRIVDKQDVDEEISRLLKLVGLPDSVKTRYPHEFSGGQRQRISIVRAIALKPKLIICDEAVSALDVSIQAQILNLLKDLQKQLKLSYLFISHGLGPVKYISDRIAVMYLGRIVEMGSRDDIFRNPQHPYTRALLSSYPIPDPHRRDKKRIILTGNVPSPINPPDGCHFHERCPMAAEICRTQCPAMRSEGGHMAACHYGFGG